jgi:hypothetical protein
MFPLKYITNMLHTCSDLSKLEYQCSYMVSMVVRALPHSTIKPGKLGIDL